MIKTLVNLDRQIFTLINSLPSNIYLDTFFSFLSGVGYLGGIWIGLVLLLLMFEEIQDSRNFYAILITGLFTLVFIEWGIKKLFKRLRPEFVLPNARVLDNLSQSFSFPSGHATMSFAAAFILSQAHKKGSLFYYILAFLISFSRIYLGKHYPIDVIVGAFIGLGIGVISTKLVFTGQ